MAPQKEDNMLPRKPSSTNVGRRTTAESRKPRAHKGSRVAPHEGERYDKAVTKRTKTGQFRKGYSGNPGAKPVGVVSLTALLKEVLLEVDSAKRKTKAERLIRKAVDLAQEGDFRYFQEIMNRMEGKVPEKILQANVSPLADYTDEELHALLGTPMNPGVGDQTKVIVLEPKELPEPPEDEAPSPMDQEEGGPSGHEE